MKTAPKLHYYAGNQPGNPRASHCWVWVNQRLSVVMVEDMEGTSVTNHAAELATEIVKEYNLDGGRLVWIEAYYVGTKDETFDLVKFLFNSIHRRCRSPQWERIDRATVMRLSEDFFD